MEKDHKPIFILRGIVTHGRGIGKLVGTPTANLNPEIGHCALKPGVYISQVVLCRRTYCGVTYIGTRPTIDGACGGGTCRDRACGGGTCGGAPSVETHIFELDREIYGMMIEVRLYKKLREQIKFPELSVLLKQIKNDFRAARGYWHTEPVSCKCGGAQSRHAFGMDVRSRCVSVNGRQIFLSGKEFALLYLLCSNPEITFPKDLIYESVWGEPSNGCLHAVENTVFQIRKKFRACGENCDPIKTVSGIGYRFSAHFSKQNEPSAIS